MLIWQNVCSKLVFTHPYVDLSSVLPSLSHISDTRPGNCYQLFERGQCLEPRSVNMTKTQCCCTSGEAWSYAGSPICEVCPKPGEGTMPNIIRSYRIKPISYAFGMGKTWLTLFILMDYPYILIQYVWTCPFCILRGCQSKFH